MESHRGRETAPENSRDGFAAGQADWPDGIDDVTASRRHKMCDPPRDPPEEIRGIFPEM